MKKLKPFILIALFCFAIANPVLAQKQPKPERVYQLKITPMSPPRPAMKYQLLPSALDTVAGNAVQLYMIGATQAPTDDTFYNQIDAWTTMDMAKLPRQKIDETLNTTPIKYVFKNFD